MPRVSTLRAHILSTQWVPWWLTGPNRGRFLFSVGAALDAGIEWTVMGIQQRFPSFCYEDALAWLGRDRRIPRGLAETAESYRRRLVRWRQTWREAGTAWGILGQAQVYFATDQTPTDQGPIVRLVSHNVSTDTATWWTIDNDGERTIHTASPSNWRWDDTDPLRPASLDTRDTRFHVIIYQDPDLPGPFQMTDTGEASLDDFVPDERNGIDLFNIGAQWKMAGSWCAGVIIAQDPAMFDPEGSGTDYPDGTWHQYGDPMSDYEPNLARPALYLEMHNHPNAVGI